MKLNEILLGVLMYPFLLTYILLFDFCLDGKLKLKEGIIGTYELLFTNIYQGHTGKST